MPHYWKQQIIFMQLFSCLLYLLAAAALLAIFILKVLFDGGVGATRSFFRRVLFAAVLRKEARRRSPTFRCTSSITFAAQRRVLGTCDAVFILLTRVLHIRRRYKILPCEGLSFNPLALTAGFTNENDISPLAFQQ